MSNTTRKLIKNYGKDKNKKAEYELQSTLNMFDKLGEECLICKGEFDKQDKTMLQSWHVVVKKGEDEVNLYCPPCWAKAEEMVEKLKSMRGENEKTS